MGQVNAKFSIAAILACTLGYLVDAYDLVLFNAVRMASLKAMGVPEEGLLKAGVLLINVQMTGLVIGGFLFGILGDKFGRTRVLFASIALYSVATLANAFIASVPAYAALRFLAGLGLAGEMGLAVTLASELVSKNHRGYAAAAIAGFGMIGAVLAGVSALHLDWKTCYIIGGVAGFALLALRARMVESGIFQGLDAKAVRGRLSLLFAKGERTGRFLLCVLSGAPIPFIFWMMIAFAPEFTRSLGLSQPFSVGEAVIFGYIGLTIGDFAAPVLSQALHSRRRALLCFQLLSFAACAYFLGVAHSDNVNLFRMLYFALGFSGGYWTLITLTSAEKFGTNLRATVATAVPNLARAVAVPMGFALPPLRDMYGLIPSAMMIGSVAFALAMSAVVLMKESIDTDLNYVER